MKPKTPTKFKKFFTDYAEYHNNPTNILIHLIFVPILTFGYLAILNFVPIVFLKRENYLFEINFVFINTFLLCVLYLYIDPLCGLLTNIWMVFSFFLGRFIFLDFLSQNKYWTCFGVFFAVNLLGWAVQIVGHKVFEKRKPAVSGNFILLYSAPFFVTAEVLKIFGWKKEEFKAIQPEIEKRIKEFHEKKNN